MCVVFACRLDNVYNRCVFQALGVCVENAGTPSGEKTSRPSMLCGEDGQWVGMGTVSSSCACRPGYEANPSHLRCRGEHTHSAVDANKSKACVISLKCVDLYRTIQCN